MVDNTFVGDFCIFDYHGSEYPVYHGKITNQDIDENGNFNAKLSLVDMIGSEEYIQAQLKNNNSMLEVKYETMTSGLSNIIESGTVECHRVEESVPTENASSFIFIGTNQNGKEFKIELKPCKKEEYKY